MTNVISTINLKGGVGKTTTTVALAETYSANLRKKVLVIDLDPQTNATLMLIGEEKWFSVNKKEEPWPAYSRTLWTQTIQGST